MCLRCGHGNSNNSILEKMIRSTFDKWIHKGEVIGSERCVNYAKMALAVWAQGRDADAFVYLDKAKREFYITADELPF